MKWGDGKTRSIKEVTEKFFQEVRARGINCRITYWNHWAETMAACDKTYFVKSKTYDTSRNEYFLGVDPKESTRKRDFLLICGGMDAKIRDIFIIPWRVFFQNLKEGKPLNTYRLPRKYMQYKVHVRNRSGKWIMVVQGGRRPEIDVTECRYDCNKAIQQLKES